jgi:peptide/nickel transport system substrate-binding protein
MVDPRNAGVNSVYASRLRAYVASVTAADTRTVVFRMKKPYAPFLGAYCSGAVRHPAQTRAGQPVPAGTEQLGLQLQPAVTNGMFKFVKWDRGSQVVLARNERYYRGAPRLEQLVVKTVSGGLVAVANQLKTGEVDIGQIDFSQVDSMRTAELVGLRDRLRLGQQALRGLGEQQSDD